MVTSLDDINSGDQLLQHLGSFWAVMFGGVDKVKQHLRSVTLSEGQNYLTFLETAAHLSRFTIPVFHTENWYLLTIKLSTALGTPSIYQPNDLVYGPQSGLVQDRPQGFIQTFDGQDKPGIVEIPLPDRLVDIKWSMQNYVLKPSKTWVNGIDFEIANGRITFRDNPFADPYVPKRDVFDDNGNKVDEEIALWVYRGEFDLDYIYTQFGYALGLRMESSEFYKELLNAYWDLHLLGPSVEMMQAFLSGLAGTPLVLNPQETVISVWKDNDNTLVITDLVVYTFPTNANIIVTAGQTVFAGDALSDAVQITELSGNNPDYSVLPALSIGKSFLNGRYLSELTFRNHSVALQYKGQNANGKTVVQFEVSGFPGDVDTFWGAVEAYGEMPGQQTLAELLDTRDNPIGQPGPTNLPPTVNPLEFILSNVMRNNLFVIRVVQGSFDPKAPGLSFFRLLREVMPPHVTYIVFVELPPLSDTFDLSQAGGSDQGGAQETVGAFFGAEGPLLDEAYEVGSSPGGNVLTYGDYAVSAYLVSLTCQ